MLSPSEIKLKIFLNHCYCHHYFFEEVLASFVWLHFVAIEEVTAVMHDFPLLVIH